MSVSDRRLSQNLPQLHMVELIKGKGTVQQVNDMLIDGFAAPVGHLCEIYPRHARTSIEAEVVRCRAATRSYRMSPHQSIGHAHSASHTC